MNPAFYALENTLQEDAFMFYDQIFGKKKKRRLLLEWQNKSYTFFFNVMCILL